MLQVLSSEVLPKHMSLQELNHAADELIKGSTAEHSALIREPLSDINRRWEGLHQDIAKKMVRVVNRFCVNCKLLVDIREFLRCRVDARLRE